MEEPRPLPPETITPEVFARWRSPVRGSRNPERLNNPFWQWMIESRLSAYEANKLLGGPSPFAAGPGWCFQRFGQTTTELPDGRSLLIGGEHEDGYDPDFYIYNDLVVLGGSGSVDIYGYPAEVFPPTDFHSASLVGSEILLIGSLGYVEARHVGQTQVIAIELETLAAKRMNTSGDSPGWVHRHQAEVQDDGKSILLTGGEVCQGERLVENLDAWRLDLVAWRWSRLTNLRWPRFEIFRADKHRQHLADMRMVLMQAEIGRTLRDRELVQQFQSMRAALESEIGSPLRLDLIPALYDPPISHEALPQTEDEFGVYRIRLGNTVVRYVEKFDQVQLTVEGHLPPETIEQLQRDLLGKLEQIERAPVICQEIPPL